MGRFVRVTLSLLVWVSLTLTCQGHDLGVMHLGVHFALFAHHDRGQVEIGERPSDLPSSVQILVAPVFSSANRELALSPSALNKETPSDIKSCVIGPSSGSPEGGDIITLGADEGIDKAASLPQLFHHESRGVAVLATQSSLPPEEPPPRGA